MYFLPERCTNWTTTEEAQKEFQINVMQIHQSIMPKLGHIMGNCKQTNLPPPYGKFKIQHCMLDWTIFMGLHRHLASILSQIMHIIVFQTCMIHELTLWPAIQWEKEDQISLCNKISWIRWRTSLCILIINRCTPKIKGNRNCLGKCIVLLVRNQNFASTNSDFNSYLSKNDTLTNWE